MTNRNQTIDIPLSTSTGLSDDEDSELDEPITQEPQIDPTQLQWLPWMWYYMKHSASKGYEVCDTAGEKLAWFFGITKPKYYSEIQEFERMDEEEKEEWRQAFQDVEQTDNVLDSIVTVHPPQSVNVYTISTIE